MRRGFTLIELLAVIVILAIIALIATPIVLDIIEGSKNSSMEQSSNMYKKAIENTIAKEMLENNVEDGTYIIDNEGTIMYKNNRIKIDIENYDFDNGILVLEKGEVKYISLNKDNKNIINGEQQTFDKWDGSIIESLDEIKTDKTGKYLIYKASELAYVSSLVNNGNTFEGVTFSLQNNLDLNNIKWTPIGGTDLPFKGIFDGNGYIIKNLTIEDTQEDKKIGLFGYIESAAINNLFLEECNVIGNTYVACVAGYALDSTINNVISYNSSIQGTNTVGSVIGRSKNSEIKNLNTYNSNVVGSTNVGGIVGASVESNIYNLNIYDSNVNGLNYDIGGLIGYSRNSNIVDAYSNTNVDNSTSTVRLSCTGGLIGLFQSGSASDLISEATILGYSDVGGVIGHIENGVDLQNVVSYVSVSAVNKVGGVIGIDSGYNASSNLKNIKSYAIVTATGEDIGGVIGGVSQGSPTYIDMYSESIVSGNNRVGGVIGGFSVGYETTLNYSNIISKSQITANTNYGDIFGYVDTTTTLNEF